MQEPQKLNMESRKRKMLLLLPLFFLPFLILLFYSITGGKKTEKAQTTKKGINQDLPAAQVEDNQKMDKLSLYREAERDSVKKSYPGRDPFASLALTPDSPAETAPAPSLSLIGSGNDLLHRGTEGRPKGTSSRLAESERNVETRLAALQQMVNNAKDNDGHSPVSSNTAEPFSSYPGLPAPGLKLARDTPVPDPELKQLNDMLEKVLDVQHPERVKERMLGSSGQEPYRAFAVAPLSDERVSNWPQSAPDTLNTKSLKKAIKAAHRFFELDEAAATDDAPNTIPAVVHETKTVVSGGSVKLRLTSAVVVNGREIPAGTTVDGIAELTGERLKVSVTKIVSKGSIIPVKLRVYDLSGLEGIYEPGAISRDASKQGADQALQSMQLATLNPSIGAQAAASGIETVKTLLSKKVRLISVTVKAGSPVLLYSDQSGE